MKFSKFLFSIFAMVALAVLSGCSTSTYTMSKVSEAPAPKSGEASITFYRDSLFGWATSAPIAMMDSNGNLSYVGVLKNGTRVVHNVEPGHYKFVVGGQSSSVMDAFVDADKYYYVEVVHHFGWWKSRFSLDPISSDELGKHRSDIVGCDVVVPNIGGEEWFEGHFRSMRKKLLSAERVSTLDSSNGVSTPIE